MEEDAYLILATHVTIMKLRPTELNVSSLLSLPEKEIMLCVSSRLQIDGVGGAVAKRCERTLCMDYICSK